MMSDKPPLAVDFGTPPPPDAISQQFARRRMQKYTEDLKHLEQMDAQLARMYTHRNGYAMRIRLYARENGLELDDNSLLTKPQWALRAIDLGLRALSIDPTTFESAEDLKRALIEQAGYNAEHPMVSAAPAIWRAWALLVAAEA